MLVVKLFEIGDDGEDGGLENQNPHPRILMKQQLVENLVYAFVPRNESVLHPLYIVQ